jgi:hypothetical protein
MAAYPEGESPYIRGIPEARSEGSTGGRVPPGL